MRKAAGIILITLGGVFLWGVIDFVAVFGIGFLIAPWLAGFQGFIGAVLLLGLIVRAAFSITGGIFCLRRKYWGICLASASFAVLASVVNFGGSLLSINIPMGLIPWVILVAEVVAVVFIVRSEKEWEDISDSVDGNDASDGD